MNEIGELSLKILLEHEHIGVVIHRWDGTIVYANNGFEADEMQAAIERELGD